ncbi:MAG: rhodanese-like domain-containing protein [Actinobacteria bacterium]|nr:rhodanese-like domain-containing protein [Actinomycetota bacterium]
MSSVAKYAVWAVLGVVVIVFGLLLFRPVEGVENVDAARTAELAAAGVRVIDVRTSTEFEAGHIAGSENVPVNELASVAEGWNRGEPLLIYCAIGDRSASAVQWLSEQGFETVYHFNAGLVAWVGPLERGPAVESPAIEPTGVAVMYEFFTDW